MKKSLKLISILLFLFFSISIIFSGCKSVPAGPTPTQVLQKFLEAIDQVDYKTAYQYLSVADKSVKDEETYDTYLKKRTNFIIDALNKEAYKTIVYTFDEPQTIDKFKVKIIAHKTMIDLNKVLIELPYDAEVKEFNATGKNGADAFATFYFDKINKKYNGIYPKATYKTEYTLIKEKNEWFVFEDIATEIIIDDYYSRAVSEDNDDNYLGALEDCNKILALDIDYGHSSATELREKIIKEMKDEEDMNNYIAQYIKIDNMKWGFVFKYPLNYIEVKGTLLNEGERALSEVEVQFQCLNAEGEILYEEYIWPISVSGNADYSIKEKLKPEDSVPLDYFELSDGIISSTKDIHFVVTRVAFAD